MLQQHYVAQSPVSRVTSRERLKRRTGAYNRVHVPPSTHPLHIALSCQPPQTHTHTHTHTGFTRPNVTNVRVKETRSTGLHFEIFARPDSTIESMVILMPGHCFVLFFPLQAVPSGKSDSSVRLRYCFVLDQNRVARNWPIHRVIGNYRGIQ